RSAAMNLTTVNAVVPTASPAIPQHAWRPALDAINEQLRAGAIATALDDLFDDLWDRRGNEADTWQAYAGACLRHPMPRGLHAGGGRRAAPGGTGSRAPGIRIRSRPGRSRTRAAMPAMPS